MAKDKQDTSSDSVLSSEKLYDVRFTQNRSFEALIGGNFIRWEAYSLPINPEYSAGLPESVVSHQDFQPVKKYFSIQIKA